MVPEMEEPRVTEIKVRIDCNGCVQKIKKALNGIHGIYDIDVDLSQQKITITGWADPEKLVKAIKKTRKSAVICVHTEQSDQPAQLTEPTPESVATPEEGTPPPPAESTNLPAESTQTEATPPKVPPNGPQQPENLPPETATAISQSYQPSKPKDVEEVHVIYHHPPDYGYRYGGQWNGYHDGPGFRGEPPQPLQPVYVTHSYDRYKPSPYVTEYAYPPPESANATSQSHQSSKPKGPEEAPVIYRHPPDYGHRYGGQWNGYHGGPTFRGEPSGPSQPPQTVYGPSQPPQPVYVTHSYDKYKPAPQVTEYAYPPPSSANATSQSHQSSKPKDLEEVHLVYHHPPDYGYQYSGQLNSYDGGSVFRGQLSQPPQPVYVAHSYNTYKPSPYVTEYIHPRSPTGYSYYSGPDNYSQDNANITSMFSEENPNACKIA